jgi:hypothetical protein
MKTIAITIILSLAILAVGCGQDTPPSNATRSGAVPVAQASLTAWQQGDAATAIIEFIEADWSLRPIFASSSVLSLSEPQFIALPAAERQAKSDEIMSQLNSVKKLTAAVAQAGRDAASNGDARHARRCFTSLKQCGMALDSPDCLKIVQLVGQALRKMGDAELGKLP